MGSVASNSYSEALDSPWCAPPKGGSKRNEWEMYLFWCLCVFPPFLSREKLIRSTDNNNRHRKPLTGTIERSDGNRPSHHIVHNNKQPTNLSNQFQSVSYLFRLDFAIVSTHTQVKQLLKRYISIVVWCHLFFYFNDSFHQKLGAMFANLGRARLCKTFYYDRLGI